MQHINFASSSVRYKPNSILSPQTSNDPRKNNTVRGEITDFGQMKHIEDMIRKIKAPGAYISVR